MANSLNIAVSLAAVIGGQSYPLAAQNTIVPAGSGAAKSNVLVATSATAIYAANSLGSGILASYVVIVNLDPTNYIDVSLENTAIVTPQVVQPGGILVLSPGAGAIWAKANTAACEVSVLALPV